MPSTSRLQQEIGQQRPFASVMQEASLALFRTTDVIRRRITATLEGHDVTLPQYNVLRILRGAGAPLPTLAIAERMIEHAPGITRMLDRMEAKGWVARAVPEHDRRCVNISLTPAGRALLDALDPVVNRADESVLGQLTPEQAATLVTLLDAIRAEPA
jgi:DNA-binding MarR family transcriptional regulator